MKEVSKSLQTGFSLCYAISSLPLWFFVIKKKCSMQSWGPILAIYFSAALMCFHCTSISNNFVSKARAISITGNFDNIIFLFVSMKNYTMYFWMSHMYQNLHCKDTSRTHLTSFTCATSDLISLPMPYEAYVSLSLSFR